MYFHEYDLTIVQMPIDWNDLEAFQRLHQYPEDSGSELPWGFGIGDIVELLE